MTSPFPQITSPPQASAEVIVNEALETLEHVAVYGKNHSLTTIGLVRGYYGGQWGGFTVSPGTFTLSASTVNYIVVALATGVTTCSTSATNWNDTTNYARVYKLTTSASTVTMEEDYRAGPGGIGGGSGGAVAQSISWKQAVRAGTTANGTLASAFANGSVIDGVTLATGDRILLKNQTTGSENGIYTVNASGAPTRATDADSGAELVNATVYISEGTTLSDTQWTCSTNAPITPGTTSLAFAQSGAGTTFTGGTLTSAINDAPKVTIASSGTVNIGAAASNVVTISGTNTITAFDTIADGADREVTFSGALTLTHNATSLILPGGVNITTAAGDVGRFRSLGSGNWRCVGYQKASGTALVVSASSLVNWTEGANTSSPNATIPVVSFVAINAATFVDAAIVPKGASGALLAAIPDGSATGGDKRGARAVDLQMSRASSSHVASGAQAVVSGGIANTSSGAQSTTSGGDSNTTSGIGATCPGGKNNNTSGDYSIGMGHSSTTRGIYGMFAHASGFFGALGDVQFGRYVLRGATTNATPKTLTSDNAAVAGTNIVVMANNSTYSFTARVNARNTSNGNSVDIEIKGTFRRDVNYSTVALVGSLTTTVISDQSSGAWTATAAANTTAGIGGIEINVTGAASTNLHWACVVQTVEHLG